MVGRSAQAGDQLVRDVLAAGPRAVVGFASAAKIHGWDLPLLPTTPKVILPPGARSSGVRAYRATLHGDDIEVVGIVPVTVAARTAVDLATVLPLEKAVATLDSALRSGQVRIGELMSSRIERRAGSASARQALLLADPLSGSVAESEARILFHRAGLPRPVSQHRLCVDGLIAVADFAWPAHMLIVEIDGRQWHTDRDAFQRDRRRQNALVDAGWRVLRFTVDDVRFCPEYVIAEIRRALSL